MLAGPAEVFKSQKNKFSAYGLGKPAFDLHASFEWTDRAYDQFHPLRHQPRHRLKERPRSVQRPTQ